MIDLESKVQAYGAAIIMKAKAYASFCKSGKKTHQKRYEEWCEARINESAAFVALMEAAKKFAEKRAK